MNLERLGPDGIAARIRDLRSRIDQLSLRGDDDRFFELAPLDENLPGTLGLSGSIGPSDKPLNPFGPGAAVRGGPTPELRAMIARVANEVGIDDNLLMALVEVESGFNPAAVSRKGALGLTQLMPPTAAALGVQDPLDPYQNLIGGAKYLRQMLTEFPDIRHALAAYNAGPGAVSKYGGVPPFPETRAYVERILARLGVR